MAEEDLPTIAHTSTMDLVGYKLTAHVLSNGERVYEVNDELKRMLADLGFGERTCVWTEDPDGVWEGSCGMMWNLESDTPAENGMNYCPRCGAKLEQAQETTDAP